MEYGKREPMKSASGREPTFFTMKAIKDMIAEEMAQGEAPTERRPLPPVQVQQPPHLRGKVSTAKTKPKPMSAHAHAKTSVAPKVDPDLTTPPTALPKDLHAAIAEDMRAPQPKKSFLSRLIGG